MPSQCIDAGIVWSTGVSRPFSRSMPNTLPCPPDHRIPDTWSHLQSPRDKRRYLRCLTDTHLAINEPGSRSYLSYMIFILLSHSWRIQTNFNKRDRTMSLVFQKSYHLCSMIMSMKCALIKKLEQLFYFL